jgi:hypothetical protein
MNNNIVFVCLQPTVHIHNATLIINHICPFQGDFHLFVFLCEAFIMGIGIGKGEVLCPGRTTSFAQTLTLHLSFFYQSVSSPTSSKCLSIFRRRGIVDFLCEIIEYSEAAITLMPHIEFEEDLKCDYICRGREGGGIEESQS